MNIENFKRGDIIVRVEPAASLGIGMDFLTGQPMELGGDRSYIGERVEYIGTANGVIYVKPNRREWLHTDFIELPLDVWSEGWEKWTDPNDLMNDEVMSMNKMFSIADLQERLVQCIDIEEYKEAEKLRVAIDALKQLGY